MSEESTEALQAQKSKHLPGDGRRLYMRIFGAAAGKEVENALSWQARLEQLRKSHHVRSLVSDDHLRTKVFLPDHGLCKAPYGSPLYIGTRKPLGIA